MSPGGRRPGKLSARDDIIRAARETFAEEGYDGTSLRAVARAAGVDAALIHHYFEGKEALVNATYQRWKQVMSAEVLRDFPVQGSPREQFRAVWARTFRCAVWAGSHREVM